MEECTASDLDKQILYHGTTRAFHDRKIKLHGIYTSWMNNPICLDYEIITPLGYAMQRAEQHDDSPLLLIVNASRVYDRILHPEVWQPKIDHLSPSEYIAIDVPASLKDEIVFNDFIKKVKKITKKKLGIDSHFWFG